MESTTQQEFVAIVKKNELNCGKRWNSCKEAYSRSVNQVPESLLQYFFIHHTYLMNCFGNKCYIKRDKELMMAKCRHGLINIGAAMRLVFSDRIISLHAHYIYVCTTAEVTGDLVLSKNPARTVRASLQAERIESWREHA